MPLLLPTSDSEVNKDIGGAGSPDTKRIEFLIFAILFTKLYSETCAASIRVKRRTIADQQLQLRYLQTD
jgi:hypothetical protein